MILYFIFLRIFLCCLKINHMDLEISQVENVQSLMRNLSFNIKTSFLPVFVRKTE